MFGVLVPFYISDYSKFNKETGRGQGHRFILGFKKTVEGDIKGNKEGSNY